MYFSILTFQCKQGDSLLPQPWGQPGAAYKFTALAKHSVFNTTLEVACYEDGAKPFLASGFSNPDPLQQQFQDFGTLLGRVVELCLGAMRSCPSLESFCFEGSECDLSHHGSRENIV